MIQVSRKDKSLILLILAVLVVVYGLWSGFSYIVLKSTFQHSAVNKLFAQDKSEEWLNVDKSLQISDLEDRIILLDFWSYACVSCIEGLQEIKKIEEQFGSKITVIGVHSGKFDNEKNFAEIRKSIVRNDIDYPVINDSSLRIWKAFNVKALPTFVLIDPHGDVEKTYSGQSVFDDVRSGIKKLVSKYKYELNRDPLPVVLEKNNIDGNVLSFPTKLEYVADFAYKTRHLPALIISNTGKNNIIVSSLSGDMIVKIGSGVAGMEDGSFEVASFNAPQGLLYRGGKLYVADTGNHALREIDFKESKVKTLIGSAQRGDVLSDEQIVEAKSFELASPTDIEFFPNNENIAISNSGTHQILKYNISKGTIRVLAGSGVEGLSDGKYPENRLAQPTDMSVYNHKLYFVDATSSALRFLEENGEVKTLLGKELGKFGNKNGGKNDALLQHPMGLMVDDTGAYISDSYNHAIKKYDFSSGALSTLAGSRKRGSGFGFSSSAEFDQPEGIVSVLNNLYVADANNNRIVILNRGSMATSLLNIMPPLKLPKEGFLQYLPNLKKSPDVAVKADAEIVLKIDLKKDWKINDMGPSFINLLEMVQDDRANLVTSFDWSEVKTKNLRLPKLVAGKKYMLQGVLYYCEDKVNALCYINSYEQNLVVDADEKNEQITVKIAY